MHPTESRIMRALAILAVALYVVSFTEWLHVWGGR